MNDHDMVIKLHYVAGLMEQNGKELKEVSKDLRLIADRLSDLAKKAETRRHWTGHE